MNAAKEANASLREAAAQDQEGDAIKAMVDLLAACGLPNFREPAFWEHCFCALVLALEPACKVQRLLEVLPHSPAPLDRVETINIMARLGYSCRVLETAWRDLDRRLMPSLVVPRRGSPFVLAGVDGQGNPMAWRSGEGAGIAAPSRDASVWVFQPFDENAQPTSRFMRRASNHTWFRALLGRFRGTVAQIMLAGLFLNVLALATPLLIMLVYDRVISAGALDALPMLALGAAIALVFEWRLRVIRSQGLAWLSGRLDNVVGNRIFSHLIGLSPDLIESASVPAQIARIKTFEAVRDFFAGSVFLSLLDAPFVFISVVTIALIAGKLVFVPLVMALFFLALFALVRRKVKISIRVAAKASSARQRFTIETFEKLQGIRAQGLGRKWQDKFRHLSGREMMAHFHLSSLGGLAETLANALTVIAAVATVGFGTQLIWNGEMSSGVLVATMILVWRVLTPLYSLCTMIPRLEQLRNSIIQVDKLMDIETEAEEAVSFSRLPKLRGGVSMHNVTFRYGEEGDIVFSGLSFEARPGDLVGITGGNGAGKATVLKLIKSLHRPAEGTVRIDSFDIRQLDAPYLRRQIAYVPKSAHFFHGSIADNLRFANPLASEEEVRQALDLADAWEDIAVLPAGMETIIGSHGDARITSTLATRLSLARAYLHPGQVLLIDELPNTLLSGRAGRNLRDYLARAKGKRTVLICTYREDFLKLADSIIWLRGLEAPQAGPRDEIFRSIQAFEANGGLRRVA